MKITDINSLNAVKAAGMKKIQPNTPMISVGMGTCGIGNDADKLFEAFAGAIGKKKVPVRLNQTGCFGFCAAEPLVNVYIPGMPLVILSKVTLKDVPSIVDSLAKGNMPVKKALCKIEEWDFLTSKIEYGKDLMEVPAWDEIPFFKGQKKMVLRDAGIINPADIEEYIAVGGYQALFNALTKMTPDTVLDEVRKSKLRGRGGAGFPVAKKWEIMKNVQAEEKYIICNADEGDPGAYMNRNEIESDPHALIEGMIIGAYVMGASKGVVYIRAEYPLAVERLKAAVKQCKALGIMGDNIFGTKFSFDLEYVEGAGAFVCGEETALMSSIEGKAGRSKPRPPFPAQKGLWGKPTSINNVESWCNIPLIINRGGDFFAKTGTDKSSGTKVFSLVGKIKNTGLVELPLGTPLESIIYQMGEGAGKNKKIKAVQTGGPSGGCIPVELFNTPVDYESLASIGAIMGSGGMVVMDQDNCMVDVARYFVEFTSSESCGKCTACREGLSQLLNILNRITRGKGKLEDLETLERLAYVIKDSSLCGLGQTSANPVLTTLRYFKNEYISHIIESRCNAGVCEDLFMALCENSCPLHMNIPAYLQMLKEGRLEEAFESTLRDNPLPGTMGRICHFHCQMRCRRESVDESVAQGEIHRYLADTMYKMGKEKQIYAKLIKEMLPKTGKKVAIAGAGPAGITLAYYLARLGHSVTVYDPHKEPGGILQYGIPAYRLPKDILQKEIEMLKKFGVKFVMNTLIGKDISTKALLKSNDIVYMAFGAQKESDLDIPGVKLNGVIPGYRFLENFAQGKKVKVGKKVAVIGAGNVAIDAARTALRLGADVTIVYRRDRNEMPANIHEIEDAEAENIKFKLLSGPKAVIEGPGKTVKGLEVEIMKLGGIDRSGRRKPVATGETEIIKCDTVILAVGEKVDPALAKELGVEINKDGTLKVDPFSYKTANTKVFAGGDAVTGPATAAEAMGTAKTAAGAIDFALMGENRFDKLFRKFEYKNEVPLKPEGGRNTKTKKVPAKERVRNFQEILSGYSGEQAKREAVRCLRCDVKSCQKQ
ncbi:MAG: FAD-dependent oxidoreductase [Candidatus Goldbacteria bacterium]|nr:FAD-dependent oxidoreductase [Candidatus Goldiibacteriota bacterium]